MGDRQAGVTALRRYPRAVQVPQPAAGADWTITVPAGVLWRLVSAFGLLATSSAVANRTAVLSIGDGDTEFCRIPATGVQAASLTESYTWGVGLDSENTGPSQSQAIPEYVLHAGAIVKSATANVDVGDQWSAVVLYVIETMVGGGPVDLMDIPELIVQLAGGMAG